MSDLKGATAGDSWLSAHARAMLESTDEGVLSLDLQGRVTFINASGKRMLGYEPEEILGANLHTLVHHTRPDGSPYPEEACPLYRAVRTGQGCRVAEEVFWRKDGSSFPVEYSSHPIVEEGKITGAVVTFIDITERKRTTEALKASEERFRLLVEGVKDYGIFMLDPESPSTSLRWQRMRAPTRKRAGGSAKTVRGSGRASSLRPCGTMLGSCAGSPT